MVTSTKPYLLRGIYDWCTESDFTPYIAAKIMHGVRVPKNHIKSNEIVLNLSSNSTQKLIFDNNFVSFSARFEGKNFDIFLPMESISGIYSRENGEGLFFEVNEASIEKRTKKIKQKIKKSHLSLVK
jgi:stringent starvation protein B